MITFNGDKDEPTKSKAKQYEKIRKILKFSRRKRRGVE